MGAASLQLAYIKIVNKKGRIYFFIYDVKIG
jgi:hypothetical protein